MCTRNRNRGIEAVHLFLCAFCKVQCVADIARQVQKAAQPNIRPPDSDYLYRNSKLIRTSSKSHISHPRFDFLLSLSDFIFTTYARRTSFTISGLTTRATIDFSSSSQLCPRANQNGPAPLRSLTLPHTSTPLPYLHLNSCRNRHPTVTPGRPSCILAAIVSILSCHHAIINLLQG